MKRRVLLKISGEVFRGKEPFGISSEATNEVAKRISELKTKRFEIAVVLGGGNIFRGIQQGPELGIERTPADQIGMLATLINGIALKSALIKRGCDAITLSALECPLIAESYQWDKVMRYLEEGKCLIFVGGTGHPFFTTDTNAALRACEIGADIVLKATTRVDGIFDKDPLQFPDAKLYTSITFQDVLKKQLGIMDLSAVAMCSQAKIPIKVFNFYKVSLTDALSDKPFGSLISE